MGKALYYSGLSVLSSITLYNGSETHRQAACGPTVRSPTVRGPTARELLLRRKRTDVIVLGCETSCDETGLALYDTDAGLLAHALYSQVDLHALYGGVVPELASRDHIRRIVPLLNAVLKDAGMTRQQIEGVGFTAGPGLAGALMTGALAARALAWSLGVPALAVHHMEAHLLAPMLETPAPDFPFLCLLVSGGHTLFVRVEGIGCYQVLGESIDDAAGEAFDKTAKLLGLGYPGGPVLSRMAQDGNPQAVPLPRPMLNRPGLDVSFSGLKTAVITRHREWQKARESGQDVPEAGVWQADLAASFEAALVDTLVEKCARGLTQESLQRLVVSGGVSANQRLRGSLDARATTLGVQVFYPRLEFCTDNGAMIALTAAQRLQAGESSDLGVQIRPRWPLDEMRPPGAAS